MQTAEGTAFTLRWDHHDAKLSETFCKAWQEKLFLDVTLACGDRTIGAHKLILAACSPLLESLLFNQSTTTTLHQHQHPLLFFNDIHYDEMLALVEFMYRGYLTVTQQTFPRIFRAAHILQIRGLSRGN